ncbi:MAG: class IV adenylate cyclase [Planctomycetes bacterium]|nr:class IV adenylate cyclase [Planctomycetota bacterium]
MALEIECKYRVESHEPIRRALADAGASCDGRFRETNHIYDTPESTLRSAGCGLRLRIWEPESGGASITELTYKGPIQPGSMKTREEQEVTVSDAEQMQAILGSLGFVEVLRYRKSRERWRLDDCRIELDDVPLLGTFVEIEGPTESTIRQAATRLELPRNSTVKDTYIPMLLEACRQGHLDPLTLGR